MKTKFFGLLAITAMSLFAFAASASATIVPGPPAPITATSVTPIALGTIIECDSVLKGKVTASLPVDQGGEGEVTHGAGPDNDGFYNCNVGDSEGDFTTPWKIVVVPDSDGDGLDEATISNIKAIVRPGLLTSCTYEGTISGYYDSTTGDAFLSGNLTRTAASGVLAFLCGSSEPVSGTYNLVDDASGLPPVVS